MAVNTEFCPCRVDVGIAEVTIYSSGSIPLANVRLVPPRGRGENCALRVVTRVVVAVVVVLSLSGRAAARGTEADRERAGGNGGREFLESVLFFAPVDFWLLLPRSSSPSGVRGQSTSNMLLIK